MAPAIPNTPDLWRASLPIPAREGHKYHRGHTAIFGSDTYTGATRLAAEACSRIGSGLVTVLSQAQAELYRVTLPPDIMVSDLELSSLNKITTLLAGPGGCTDAQANQLVAAAADLAVVLDADALRLRTHLQDRTCILTPHEGEFERYFGPLDGDPLEHAAKASEASGAIIVLKRPETIIAAPDGRLIINTTSSRYLAKAGTGDVLAGLIAGLVAQGMPPVSAAAAAVWIHGTAGAQIGPGLVPQDMFARFGPILRDLLA